jgi:hypothetical protein
MKEKQSINAEHHHACRPLCSCCGGGDYRKGYTKTKAASHSDNAKSRRSKPKYKNHR